MSTAQALALVELAHPKKGEAGSSYVSPSYRSRK